MINSLHRKICTCDGLLSGGNSVTLLHISKVKTTLQTNHTPLNTEPTHIASVAAIS